MDALLHDRLNPCFFSSLRDFGFFEWPALPFFFIISVKSPTAVVESIRVTACLVERMVEIIASALFLIL